MYLHENNKEDFLIYKNAEERGYEYLGSYLGSYFGSY
jgi:hypothetical protein